MELTPQSARSPTSPLRYLSDPQPLYEYPSPAQSDSRFRSTESLPGLDLYSCPMPGSTAVETSSGSQVHASTTTNDWPTTGIQQHRNNHKSPHSTPNILSAEYDPFAPFHPEVSAPYTHDIYAAQTAEVTILPAASPVPSGNTSQRSSFSSAPASEIFTQASSVHSYTPRIKMEDHPDFAQGSDSILLGSPQLSHNLLTSASSYPGSLEATFYQDPGWSKVEYASQDHLPSISTLPIPQYGRRSESQEHSPAGSLDHRRGPARTRIRKLTTKEDANFQCHVKGCGKLFGRSYNFKAHMETHDASREYPFPCPLKDCNKKFVRKTDLQRHHQSVHMKQRNHRCDYCSRYFARKDTLRRHMEDGCSKRFDIETVDFRPQSYSTTSEPSSLRTTSRLLDHHQPRQQFSYSSPPGHHQHHPQHHYSSPPGSSTSQGSHDVPLTSASGAYLHRQDFITGESSQEPVWTS